MTQGAFILNFDDERDFVRATSVLLGAAYVSGTDAITAINSMEASRSFGSIVAHQALPIPAADEQPA